VTSLRRRLGALEQAAWDRRKRQVLRAACADIAREERWPPGRLEREVQAALKEWEPMELEMEMMGRQGKNLGEVVAWLAAEMGIDPDELLAATERRGAIATGRRR
jgi:hypothetical protein